MADLLQQVNRDFRIYLSQSGNSVNVAWRRTVLRERYLSFKEHRHGAKLSFGTFLYKGTRTKPPLVRCNKSTVRLLQASRRQSNRLMPSVSAEDGTPLRSRTKPSQRTTPIIHKAQKKNGLSPTNRNLAVNQGSAKMFHTTGPASRKGDKSTTPKPSAGIRVERHMTKYDGLDSVRSLVLNHTQSAQRSTERQEKLDKGPVLYYAQARPSPQSKTVENAQIDKDEKQSSPRKTRATRQDNGTDRQKPRPARQSKTVVAGIRPKFMSGGWEVTVSLPNYLVPAEVEMKHLSGRLKRTEILLQELSVDTYIEKFHLLLYIEELRYNTEIESYTMTSASMQKKPHSKLLRLNVPGLAENRPSLLVGDRVYAVKLDSSGDEYGDEYEGFVHCIEQQHVALGLNDKLLKSFQNNMKFSVRFTFNRRPLRLMHRALDDLKSSRLCEMLFPKNFPKPYTPKKKLIMKARHIESNKEQRAAVENIVLGNTPPIYVIFGPPGTGKTVTMVESIYQTHKEYNYNILVCALCNNACDMLASKLTKCIDKNKMIRLYAASRSWSSVPKDIKEGNTNFRDGEIYMPQAEELLNYRVIVCTFVTAGRIASMGVPKDHFKRIFIDESGQAFEPECLVAVSKILAKDGKLILAGDPKQLGPIVRSPLAIRHGLQMSLLQRLMDTCHIYRKDEATGQYNPQCVTKLVNNYRSHEAILKISNQYFYDGDLRVCADELKRTRMCSWDGLPNPDFPIIFHGIEGKQTRDESSPSYYNPDEVKVVKGYVDKLMAVQKGNHKLQSPADIGIVTPYRKQCEKIRRSVQKYPGIDVGSVEVFQGQERPVIIISTVRSSKEGLSDDAKHHLGFLCDPKRFNVALTRAQGLLIIVGNPRLLSLDKYWKSLLVYCMENKSYRGAKFTSADFRGASDMEEIERLFSKMEIDPAVEFENDDDFTAPFWRTEH